MREAKTALKRNVKGRAKFIEDEEMLTATWCRKNVTCNRISFLFFILYVNRENDNSEMSESFKHMYSCEKDCDLPCSVLVF